MDPFESVPGYFLHLQIRRRAKKKKTKNKKAGKSSGGQKKKTAANKFTYTFTHSGV